ncbi:myosin-2 heavy chain, non muscle-like [Helianthus annuus]|uniref:myosin-2 heavy chain, non muscle-like n=1 Tax=Helianthus annuus TaxID=4232 RepID=UPI000B903AFE|nr:myosin-2 heavy chain, non muscle-like [Helianthus annuus]
MELIDIRWCMASVIRRAQRFMEITGRNSINGPSKKLGFDKSKAIYHRNREEPPRMKQIEETPKEKTRALAVIQDDESFDWSEFLPEDDAVGYAFMAKVEPYKDTRTEEQKYTYRKMIAQTMKDSNYRAWKEAKRANRWDPDRECYLDPKGNIIAEPSTPVVETLIESLKQEDEQRERDAAKKAEEEELKSRKFDDGIIDTTKEMTAENLTNMADKVLRAKELEVDSKTASESRSKVSKSGSNNESGKTGKAKTESDCKNCMKDCKVCSTNAYLTVKNTEELVGKVRMVEEQILSRDKLMRASNERKKELSERIEKYKTDVERFKKENEKLIHENRQLSENHEKLKRTIKDSDERNGKTYKENLQLSGVLQAKERQINQQLDEIANLKLQFQEAKIENERINLKLNSYSSASFVLQHIVPKPIGKNKAGEDVYSDGTGRRSGLDNEDETNEKTNDVKLPETIDVTLTSSSDEDSVQSEVVKNVVENVLKSDSE